jgi:hypothetical protein
MAVSTMLNPFRVPGQSTTNDNRARDLLRKTIVERDGRRIARWKTAAGGSTPTQLHLKFFSYGVNQSIENRRSSSRGNEAQIV